ncbi:MAG: hypothetical protein AAF652_12840 [Cyanobacteria bacterium P01_C01_bin.72]
MQEENNNNQYWLTKVEPLDGESISLFLGRFRRAKGNRFSAASGLGRVVCLGAVLARWEKFYVNPFPTQQELEAVAEIVMLDVDRLRLMFPPPGTTMKCKPTLLCAACYQEKPHHRIEWQFKDKMRMRSEAQTQSVLDVKPSFTSLLCRRWRICAV